VTPFEIARRAAAKLFRWEVACVIAESLGIALGLWFMLGKEMMLAGGASLFLVCGMSFFIRARHYVGIVRKS
jgi:hypothetical protein